MRASVVLGFKNWGLDRLSMCIESIHGSLRTVEHEVIVCDFGSTEAEDVLATVTAADATYTRVESGALWSRSQALNAAAALASGDVLLATDADMLFTPAALTRVVEEIERNANQIIILQCRDLPVGMDSQRVANDGIDFDRFFQIGQVRPRWGMGGLVGIGRDKWKDLRGWEERMHTYGGEDIDFVRRGQRLGLRTNWMDEPGVGMFHVWHPSTSKAAERSPAATAAIAFNRSLHGDETYVRNYTGSNYLPEVMPPIVSICLTGDESTASSTLLSILTQTVHDIEILVPRSLVHLTDTDARVRVGALGSAQGLYIMLARAGDWWPTRRIELLLAETTSTTGIVSDWVSRRYEYDNGHVETVAHPLGDPYNAMTRRALLQPDDLEADAVLISTYLSGTRWAVLSVVGRHVSNSGDSEEAIAEQDTRSASLLQQIADSSGVGLPELPAPPLLPEAIPLQRQFEEGWFTLTCSGRIPVDDIESFCSEAGWTSEYIHFADLQGLPLADHHTLRGQGEKNVLQLYSLAGRHGATVVPGVEGNEYMVLESLVNYCENLYGGAKPGWWVVAKPEENAEELLEMLRATPGVLSALGRTWRKNGEQRTVVLGRTPSLDIAQALKIANSFAASSAKVQLVKAEGDLGS